MWQPVGEEEEEVRASSSKDSETSEAKPSQGDDCPPSPRTLEAIQAALNDCSDEEEEEDQETKDGRVSPRTLLAIQQALTEEDDGASVLSAKPKTSLHRPIVISSSDEETQPSPEETSDFKTNAAAQSPRMEDSVLDSSSEEEMEEVIEQRNKALRLAALQQTETGSDEEQTGETEELEELRKTEFEPLGDESNQNALTISPRSKPESTGTNTHPGNSEEKENVGGLEETNGDEVKSESGEDSDSEGKRNQMFSIKPHSALEFSHVFMCGFSQRVLSRSQTRKIKSSVEKMLQIRAEKKDCQKEPTKTGR